MNGFGSGSMLQINFDKATDQRGFDTSNTISSGLVNHLFNFSRSIGTDYIGRWTSSSSFLITITNAAGASLPLLGQLQVQSNAGARIRALPFSIASNSTSPVLQGSFYSMN